MQSLKDQLTYSEYDDIPKIFYRVSEKLEEVHLNKKCVSDLSADTIFISEEGISFQGLIDYSDDKKIENIRKLTKLMLGSYISLSSEFRDFSMVSDGWFRENFYEILDSLKMIIIPAEHIERVMISGVVEYFNKYYDFERSLVSASSSKSNEKVLVLKKAGYNLQPEENSFFKEDLYNKKSAYAKGSIYLYILAILSIIILILLLFKVI